MQWKSGNRVYTVNGTHGLSIFFCSILVQMYSNSPDQEGNSYLTGGRRGVAKYVKK
jgi:hypothetical protein